MRNQNSEDFSFGSKHKGVDLNVNFDADWGGGTNILYPHPQIISDLIHSEKETQAIVEL